MTPTARPSVGVQIRRARKRQGWTQADLAGRVGVKPEYISHIEAGRRIPAVERAERIATVLGLPKEDLVFAAIAHRYPRAKSYLEGVRETRMEKAGFRRLKVILEEDREAGLWVTYVPSLGHLSTYGHSKREALLQTREAVRGYFEAAKKAGLDLPTTDGKLELLELEVTV